MALLHEQTESFLLRGNKEVGWLEAYDDLFEQYIDVEPGSIACNTFESAGSSKIAQPFDSSSFSSTSDPADPFHDSFQNIGASPALQSAQDYHISPGLFGKASFSDVQLSGLCGIDSTEFQGYHVAQSAPVSPVPVRPIKREGSSAATLGTIESRNQTFRGEQAEEEGDSTKMMRPSYYRSATFHGLQLPGYDDTEDGLEQYRSDSISLTKRSEYATIPSDDGRHRITQLRQSPSWHSPQISSGMGPPRRPISRNKSYHMRNTAVPTSTMTFVENTSAPMFHEDTSRALSIHAQMTERTDQIMLVTALPDTHLSMESWTQGAEEVVDYSLSASPSFEDRKPQPWWSPVSTPLPSSPVFQSTQAPYLEKNNHASLLQLKDTSDLASSGLMIQCRPEALSETLAASPTENSLELSPKPYSQESQGDFSLTPTTPHTAEPRRSPSPPPTSPSVRNKRASSRSRQSRHRRKSSGQSVGRSPGVGFVNFTPDDSRKILTGVAPSGSSKTKARREKEAEEKRRKLSEAARRAVIQAGGDIRALEREGLLCDGSAM